MNEPVTCQDCGEPLKVAGNVQVGEILECESCGAEMEVIGTKPLEISLIEEEK